jgi:hypothetical protein
MRVGLIISTIIHVVIFLWIMVAPGETPLDLARADPVMVELVSPKEVPQLAAPERAKPETAKSELPAFEPLKEEPKPTSLKPASLKPASLKTAPLKAAPRKPELAKPEPAKPEPNKPEPNKPVLAADAKPSPAPETVAPNVEDQAVRFRWMFNLPTASLTGGGGLPSESGTKLLSDEIAKFKAQVSKCWVAPDVPSDAGLNVVIRVALQPDGSLGAEPELVLAPASVSGPLLVERAKQALQQCQPYSSLPPDKYQDWMRLELGFSVDGPSVTPTLGGASRQR